MDPDRRWAHLFADLDAQLDAAEAADLELEVRERARGESARLRFADRLRAAVGSEVAVDVVAVGALRGRVAGVGPDWLLLDAGGEVLIPAGALVCATGLTGWSDDPAAAGEVFARLGLRHALRELARRRTPVVTTLVDGRAVHGTIDRVGADFAEIAEHPAGEPRRANAVRAVRTVPFSAVAAVRAA